MSAVVAMLEHCQYSSCVSEGAVLVEAAAAARGAAPVADAPALVGAAPALVGAAPALADAPVLADAPLGPGVAVAPGGACGLVACGLWARIGAVGAVVVIGVRAPDISELLVGAGGANALDVVTTVDVVATVVALLEVGAAA